LHVRRFARIRRHRAAVSVLPVTAELRPFPTSDLVAGDVMLAQKIALETNERGALSVAHRSFVSMDPRR